MRLKTTVESVTRRLARAGCVAAAEEAAELLSAAPDDGTLDRWTERREQGEPLAWMTGSTHFCGRRVLVDPGVYVPRPQSEELARRAGDHLGPGRRAADLCTGSGAVATHLMAAAPDAVVVAVDLDVRAVACARRNGVRAILGSLDSPLRSGGFDVVTAVAPYVPTPRLAVLPSDVRRYEPRLALDGGGDGLDIVRAVVAGAGRLLRAGGWLFLELGADQDRALEPTLARRGFDRPTTWRDADGDLRGLAVRATRPGG